MNVIASGKVFIDTPRQHSYTRRGRSGRRSEQPALGRGLDRTQTLDARRAASTQAEPHSTQDTRRPRSGRRSEQTALERGLDRTQTLDALRAAVAQAGPDSTQTPGVPGAVGARSRQRSGGARQHSDTRPGRSGRRSADSARAGPARTQTPDALGAAGAQAEPDSTQTPGVAGAVTYKMYISDFLYR